ncbi:MAG: DMT family transporter [Burkholderiaceae bacterium]
MSARRTLAVEFVLLAAIWGASFLFMRIAVPQFGPAPSMWLRCSIGALTLTPLLIFGHGVGQLRSLGARAVMLGLFNSALPFLLFGFAALRLPAGVLSVLNATAPFWAAIVAFVWLNDRLAARQTAGLLLGFAGVVILVLGMPNRGSTTLPDGALVGVMIALAATLCYGIAANYTRRRLSDVDPRINAVGSQWAAAAWLTAPGLWQWPTAWPDSRAWMALIVLGVLCTGLAYLLFFRLIHGLGPARAITVTYLIPAFGMFWGALFLSETITPTMVTGAVVIVAGTALTSAPRRRPT